MTDDISPWMPRCFSLKFQIILTYFQYEVNFGKVACKAISFLEKFSYSSSILHLATIGFERYIFFTINSFFKFQTCTQHDLLLS